MKELRLYPRGVSGSVDRYRLEVVISGLRLIQDLLDVYRALPDGTSSTVHPSCSRIAVPIGKN